MSWIDIDDVISAIRHCVTTSNLTGPLNVVAPQAVTNAGFTRTLGKVLRRPTILPFPAPVARLMLGEMADALLLASAHVKPMRMRESGFQFRYPDLEASLRHVLGR
jgi:NAD dependent epimerase/dehydratase family enzyme